jgi:putative ATP-dependent endonuclease of OLD family
MLEDLSTEVQRWNRPQTQDSVLGLFGSGSHNLALLLVLGSLLDLRGDEALPPDARPIIAIEEPESHLHPILLASTWDVIEALQAQTVVTTNSGDLLSSVPMHYLRRLVRNEHGIDVHRLRPGSLSLTDQRRVAYHIRARRGGVLFARCWMLVEGESEFWLLGQLAQAMGYDLDSEGVRLIEFAQCGVGPLVKLANGLGIAWHLLADGDESGQVYAREATRFAPKGHEDRHVTMLGYRDVETCLWHEGFEDVYREAARIVPRPDGVGPAPGRVIHKAVRKKSKPYLAIAVAEAAAERGPETIPVLLRTVIERSIQLAREATS